MALPSASPILCSSAPAHRPFPGLAATWTAHMAAQAAEDLALVSAHFDGFASHIATVDPDADIEDFWEPLARSAATIRAAAALGTTVEQTGPETIWTEEMMTRRLGSVWSHEEERHGLDPLLLHPVLQEHSGRWMSLAGYTDTPGELAPEDDAVHLLHSRAQAGVKKAVVKFSTRKTGLFTVDLHQDMSIEDVSTALTAGEDTFWTLYRMAGQRDTLLLQDWIPMAYEYRLFVVDGKLVSGAGNIEEFTPYNRRSIHGIFDARVRKNRGNSIMTGEPSVIESRPGLVDRYLDFGDELAAQYAGTVTIDVALNEATGEIIIVELNTLPNSGLYAANTDVIYAALSVAKDRGYGSYGWAPISPEKTTTPTAP